jgi:ketosteroid isomerase-like protein
MDMLRHLGYRLASIALVTMTAFGGELTGTWIGTLEELAPDGSIKRTRGAYLDLRLSGQTVTGTAGPSESEQQAISGGKLNGGRNLTFEVVQAQGPTMKFDLIFDGDTIKGAVAAEGGGKRLDARIDVRRKMVERAGDREAIRAHIDRIFQAFIHKNSAELRATHAENWLGYLEGSRTMIRGADGYMNWSGYFEPNSPYGMTGYKMREFDMIFHGDAAFVAFVAEVESTTPNGPYQRTLRITDFYTKQNGAWIQTGSDTELHPESNERRYQEFRTLSEPEKKSLLAAREAVWRAWFGGDRAALEKLLPQELLAMSPGDGGWENRKAVLDGSARFASSGGKLVHLEFPKTEIQVYGATAIVYSKYVYEIEEAGKRSERSGRVTEVFVRHNEGWVNPSWHMDSGK